MYDLETVCLLQINDDAHMYIHMFEYVLEDDESIRKRIVCQSRPTRFSAMRLFVYSLEFLDLRKRLLEAVGEGNPHSYVRSADFLRCRAGGGMRNLFQWGGRDREKQPAR